MYTGTLIDELIAAVEQADEGTHPEAASELGDICLLAACEQPVEHSLPGAA